MHWADLLDGLKTHGYRPTLLEHSGPFVEVTFTESEHARMFAGSLIAWGVPRRYRNNYVNCVVSFPDHFAPRILELL